MRIPAYLPWMMLGLFGCGAPAPSRAVEHWRRLSESAAGAAAREVAPTAYEDSVSYVGRAMHAQDRGDDFAAEHFARLARIQLELAIAESAQLEQEERALALERALVSLGGERAALEDRIRAKERAIRDARRREELLAEMRQLRGQAREREARFEAGYPAKKAAELKAARREILEKAWDRLTSQSKADVTSAVAAATERAVAASRAAAEKEDWDRAFFLLEDAALQLEKHE